MELTFLIGRAKGMIIRPLETWQEIKTEETTVSELFIEHVLPMAAIPAVAHLLGFWYHGFFDTIFRAILWYGLAVAGIWVLGKIIFYLSANFDAVPNEAKSFQLAAYSFTPFFLAGICYILPFLSILVFFAGLYGIYTLTLGMPILMEAPPEKASGYSITAGAAMFVIVILIGRSTGGVFWPGKN